MTKSKRSELAPKGSGKKKPAALCKERRGRDNICDNICDSICDSICAYFVCTASRSVYTRLPMP